MNINDILIQSVVDKPKFECTTSANYLPIKRIVISKIKKEGFDDIEIPNDNYISLQQDVVNGIKDDFMFDSYNIQEKSKKTNGENLSKKKNHQKRSTKSNQISKIAMEEKKRVKKRIGNFDQKNSEAWKHLSLIYGPQIKQDKLISIAEYAASQLQIFIDRDARRRKCILIKWFDENWNKISPLFQFYHL